jgi:hypothetical protein
MISQKEKDLTVQLLIEKLQRISGKQVILKETTTRNLVFKFLRYTPSALRTKEENYKIFCKEVKNISYEEFEKYYNELISLWRKEEEPSKKSVSIILKIRSLLSIMSQKLGFKVNIYKEDNQSISLYGIDSTISSEEAIEIDNERSEDYGEETRNDEDYGRSISAANEIKDFLSNYKIEVSIQKVDDNYLVLYPKNSMIM